MFTRAPKTIVLRPILGFAPGVVLAAAVGCVALGVLAAVTLDSLSRGDAEPRASEPISTAVFEQPAIGLVRTAKLDQATPWTLNAAPFPVSDRAPRLAIVVIDDGSDAGAALSAMRLAAPITLAIAPTADSADKRAAAARRYGREVLLLLPMQSETDFDTAPNPIAIHIAREELQRRMNWNLAQIDGYVGLMNAAGEATTRDAETMRAVMEVVQARGLGYVDARSHADSVGSAVARRMGVPTGDRILGIAPGSDVAEMGAGLAVAAAHAERWGAAIVTVPAERRLIAALQDWVDTQQTGVKVAPVTAVVRRLRSAKL